MISSMTGFGKSVASDDKFVIEAEIRSLNSRFLDISIRLPRDFSDFEIPIREQIKKRIHRGKVSLNVYLNKEENGDKFSNIDTAKLNKIVEFLRNVKQIGNLSGEVSLAQVMEFVQDFSADQEIDVEKYSKILADTVDQAITNFNKMRLEEGEQLRIDLEKRCEGILNSVEEVQKLNRGSVVEYFEKIRERAKELYESLESNPDRLNLELALLAEKYDLTEECVRLKSHLKLFRESLSHSEEAGRKLNFISQEINREANTINSKTISTEIAHHGIYIKEELEKIREQIQNIE
ncbi:MAG: YicC family protein [Melioribacteraceae bacterium]|nr:YicC family protein [Melioribacteraceae bacterium]MCF8264874.1 YicC family protein [Melioribacteraceae bacterium]MCF8412992.1 YicC family protein [Melioribacteraceae bacterium]MCF8431347.1 YicC family protein [Melioribacteraceae bacterium]